MPQQELLIKVLDVLGRLGIESMLTGSWASSLHGVPRATHDVDLIVELNLAQIEPLAAAFPAPEYYLSTSAMRDAVERKRMFNLLDVFDGDKVDFWLLTDSPFDQSRFSRKSLSRLGNIDLFVASPEDTILSKLDWAQRSGGSEKQFGDALQIYEIQAATLDHEYLRRWSRELRIDSLFDRMVAESQYSEDDALPPPF